MLCLNQSVLIFIFPLISFCQIFCRIKQIIFHQIEFICSFSYHIRNKNFYLCLFYILSMFMLLRILLVDRLAKVFKNPRLFKIVVQGIMIQTKMILKVGKNTNKQISLIVITLILKCMKYYYYIYLFWRTNKKVFYHKNACLYKAIGTQYLFATKTNIILR